MNNLERYGVGIRPGDAERQAPYFYNNTIFSEVAGGTTSNTHWRNNLILAQNSYAGFGGGGRGGRFGPAGDAPSGGGRAGGIDLGPSPVVFGFSTFTNYSSSDYNGFRPNPGAPYGFERNSPPVSVAADYNSRGHNAKLETRRFKTLQEYQEELARTGTVSCSITIPS